MAAVPGFAWLPCSELSAWVLLGLLVAPVECSGIKEVASIEAEEWQPCSAEGRLDNLMGKGWDVFSLSV